MTWMRMPLFAWAMYTVSIVMVLAMSLLLIMVGGSVSAFFGELHFWWPKITGRIYSERLAKFAAISMFFGFNFTFSPQFVLGYLGMPRRYHEYPAEWQP